MAGQTAGWKQLYPDFDLREQAIGYLRREFGVVRYELLPYRGMLVLVTYIFYYLGSRSLTSTQADLLRLWFWQVAFSERYASSTLTLMTEDRKLFEKFLEGKHVTIDFKINIDTQSISKIRMYRASAIKNAVLCLLIQKRPLHFKNNSPIELGPEVVSDFDSAEKHHIFPKAFVSRRFGAAAAHSLANFCFLPAELNKEISSQRPSAYFAKYAHDNPDFTESLASHLIPYTDAVKKDDFEAFLYQRAVKLRETIEAAVGTKLAQVIATDADVSQRLDQYLAKDPGLSASQLTSRSLLDYCNLMDYPKILFANWSLFYPVFRSKDVVLKKPSSLNEYRNSIKHGKPIASFIKKEGEAALEWLLTALKPTKS